MTSQTVPALSFVTMGISLLFGIAIPVGLFIYYRKKYDCKIKPFITGFAIFAIFALVLEGIFHTITLGGGRQQALMAKPVLYGLYGGFMAGFFEETGRLLAFKTILEKSQDNDNTALMYGAGHGGFEAFYLLFATAVSNIVMAVMINSGNTQALTANLTGEKLIATQQLLTTIISTHPLTFCAGVIERIPSVAIHISLSIIVWFAAKNKRNWYFYPLAILLHLIVDAIAGTLSIMNVNAVLIEVILYICAGIIVFVAYKIWRKFSCNKSQIDV